MLLGRLGEYELLEKAGEGGMGIVFKARDTRLRRIVALKVIASKYATDPEFRERLLREARVEASLNHPAIATCFEIGEAVLDPPDLLQDDTNGVRAQPVSYLAMEYVPGQDLFQLSAGEPLSIDRVLDFGIQIASGLEAAHGSGVIHRDLKPANVRVTPSGQVKILDFGLARVRASEPVAGDADTSSMGTSGGRILGTPDYMSPEQARGRALDARSDLFSFGILLYEIVTGRPPFHGASRLDVFNSIAHDEPPPLARFAHGVPDELQRIVSKLLAKQPGDRYQSAHEVLTDLRRLEAGRSSAARPGGPVKVRPARIAAGVACFIVLTGVVWWNSLAGLTPGARSLAVLSFENRSGDHALDDLGTGLPEEIAGDLVQYSNLNVVSPAVAGVGTSNRSLKVLAHELGVHTFLTGTVRREDSGPRLRVELVQAPTGRMMWSADYDASVQEVPQIKRDIVEHIASFLSARVARGDKRSRDATRSLSAYNLYLRAVRQLDDADDPLAVDRAADLFGQAIVADPEFAAAWSGRSRALARLYARDKRPEALRSAELAADRAVELAPQLLDALLARAQILRVTGKYPEAIAELNRVIKTNPNWDQAHVELAATYRDAGQLSEAEQSDRRAIALRPDSWRHWNKLGALLIQRGDYLGARAAFEQVVRLVPEKNRGYEQLAALSIFEGKFEQAVAEYRRLPTPVSDAELASNVGTAYFYAGRLTESLDYYALAVRLDPGKAILRRSLGDLYLRQGSSRQALDSYREAGRLAEAALHANPADTKQRLECALDLAKAGKCEAARRTLGEMPAGMLAESSECAYTDAMVQSLCGQRSQALAALRRALRMGISPERVRGDVEFAAMRDDSAFVRLLAVDANGSAATAGAVRKASGVALGR